MTIKDLAEIFPLLMELVTTGIILVATRYIIPWLKEQRTYSTIKKFVRAAEKLAESGELAKKEKKAYVVTLLAARGIKITAEVDAMIEAAVEALDIAKDTIIAGIVDGEE